MLQRELLIHLNLVSGLGPSSITRLTENFASADELFAATPTRIQQVLGRQDKLGVAERILEIPKSPALTNELELARKEGAQLVTVLDEEYPALLKAIPNPPVVLYVKGNLLQEDAAAVAIVGTRLATHYGLGVAKELARGLAKAGVTVVSGLAEGIDAAAHAGALEGGGRTLAVLGHGLQFIYPPDHRGLSQKIIESGALVSEFPMGIEPERGNFPRRNRVISGLSLGVIVAEAPVKSGALITAREALDQNREVFAVPGPVSSSKSTGAHQLIKDGAKLVESVYDVIEELFPQLHSRLGEWKELAVSLNSSKKPLGLSAQELEIYEKIPVAGASVVEALLQGTKLPPQKLLGVLTELELKGLVRQVPGRGYSRL